MKIVYLVTVAVLLASCGGTEKKSGESADAAFDEYKKQYIAQLWRTYPGWASSVGYHNYDSVLVIPDENSRKTELSFANSQLDSLKKYTPESLSDNNKTDYRLIENQLQSVLFSVNEQ
ncbi:MAG: DUF885 domain-containing protein, partial [Bacteroidota bacterium]